MEAQENSQTEQNGQAPKKRELALVSRSTYIKEKALQWIFFACAFLAVVTVILIFVFTTYSALPVFTDIGLADFFSFTWAPSEGHYGIVSLLAGSGLVTVGALAMGVPLGVGTAVYLVEIAGKRVRKLISPAVDLLAGIPSIIYGFFGMIIIRPFIAQLTGGLGFGALTAWFVLAIMIVPTITTLTIDALNSIPMGIREASYAMGATKWQTIYKVVLPAAKLGIVDAIVLGMGRAIGETGYSRQHREPHLDAHEPDRARHELFLGSAPLGAVRYGRGPVYHLRHAGGHRPSDFQEKEGVGYVRFR